MLETAELYFNVDHGYLEGLVRGCKASLLTQQDYVNLVQCETLEGKPLASSHSNKQTWCCSLGGGERDCDLLDRSPEEVFGPGVQIPRSVKRKWSLFPIFSRCNLIFLSIMRAVGLNHVVGIIITWDTWQPETHSVPWSCRRNVY